jgi:putative acetyltransferase
VQGKIEAPVGGRELSLPALEIRPLRIGENGAAFRTLNEEWITRYFILEEHDREVLGDPESAILRAGGQVFMAYIERETVGCVALIPTGDGIYELSKMAVAPQYRGCGIGRRLIHFTIEQAKLMGAKSLFLGSSTKLPNAVRLYESVGFRHVPRERVPPLLYDRTDVFMEMDLS